MDQAEKDLRDRLIAQFGTPPTDIEARLDQVKALAKRKGMTLAKAADALFPKGE